MGLPAWMGKNRESNNARSRAHERKVAKDTGGKVQAGSGSSWRARQDVKDDTHLIQHKFTDGKGYRVTVDEWNTISADAARSGREPVLIIDFDGYGKGLRLTITEGGPGA